MHNFFEEPWRTTSKMNCCASSYTGFNINLKSYNFVTRRSKASSLYCTWLRTELTSCSDRIVSIALNKVSASEVGRHSSRRATSSVSTMSCGKKNLIHYSVEMTKWGIRTLKYGVVGNESKVMSILLTFKHPRASISNIPRASTIKYRQTESFKLSMLLTPRSSRANVLYMLHANLHVWNKTLMVLLDNTVLTATRLRNHCFSLLINLGPHNN